MLAMAIGGETLAARVASLMAERHWTAYRVAKETGLSTTYVDKILRGLAKHPSYSTLQRLAMAFGLDNVDELGAPGQSAVELPTEGLHPLVIAVSRRIGKYLNEADWARVAGYMEAVAEERRAHGYNNMEEPGEAEQQPPAQQTA